MTTINSDVFRISTLPHGRLGVRACTQCGTLFLPAKRKGNARNQLLNTKTCGCMGRKDTSAASAAIRGKKRTTEPRSIAAVFKRHLKAGYMLSPCSECGTPCAMTQCGAECRAESKRRWAWEKQVRGSILVCPECGVEHCALRGYGSHTFCSDACRQKTKNRNGKSHKSRAKIHGVQYDYFNVLSVLIRDNWTCQECGIETPRKLRGTTEPNAPELDHIIPIAMGGPHTIDNTQCLCRQCNGDKGALSMDEWGLGVSPDYRPTSHQLRGYAG